MPSCVRVRGRLVTRALWLNALTSRLREASWQSPEGSTAIVPHHIAARTSPVWACAGLRARTARRLATRRQTLL